MAAISPTENALRALPMSLFPTMDTLEQVFEYAEAKLPMTTRNEIYALLAIYHNTLLKAGTSQQ